MWLVLLKCLFQLKLHYVIEISNINEFVQTLVVQHRSLSGYIKKPKMVRLPHLAGQSESEADIRTRVFDGMQQSF